MADSPFEIVTTKKSSKLSSKKIIIGLVVVLFMAVGVLTGVILVRQNQDIGEEASSQCPEIEACPSGDNLALLINCTPSETQSLCSTAFTGQSEMCGGQKYCCNGSVWTANLSACNATPTPTATPTKSPSPMPTATQSSVQGTPTATPTKSPTPTPTATSTSSGQSGTNSTKTSTPSPTPTQTQTGQTVQATKPPVPETGTGLPTILTMALGVLVIIGSFFLAF